MGLEEVATEVFRNSWYFYQTALQGDYLNHSILYQPLQDGMRTKQDFRLLDLGCGTYMYSAASCRISAFRRIIIE
jgi:hypothetical protein